MTLGESGLDGPDNSERKVLVGRVYSSMSNNWSEWEDKSFEEVCAEIVERRGDKKVRETPDEIIEVIIVRRAVIKGEVRVEEVAS